MSTVEINIAAGEKTLSSLSYPVEPAELIEGIGPLELEIGFGRGRYLLRCAAEHPERRFLGIEVAARYFRLVTQRARRRGLDNLTLIRAEALYLLSVVLPREIATAVHVYFPDPWPKSRHHRRRLFDVATVDLVTGLLSPGGVLYFATDHLAYGESVVDILRGLPTLEVRRRDDPWPDGARTNYEVKYEREGRPILRLEAHRLAPMGLHPVGRCAVLADGPRHVEEAG